MRDRPFEDREYPEPDNEDDDDLITQTVTCPSCGREVYEDAEQCPICGDYITPGSSSVFAGKPIWFVVIAILGIIAFILTFAL
ncbi:hypothetical protein Pan216_46260 [Planctomycetes bacterium Pan216]|uniref:Zinc-ribbon domain-containing protein n=1 Tax=Kolteria novifilia TaxID=2527975 RepID=A0A518B9T5_9BACT|nr:hypothetical protein Pan216_46260 [Planctomycetes bacterium Pan216]